MRPLPSLDDGKNGSVGCECQLPSAADGNHGVTGRGAGAYFVFIVTNDRTLDATAPSNATKSVTKLTARMVTIASLVSLSRVLFYLTDTGLGVTTQSHSLAQPLL